jgi:hypothetical protein
MGPRRGGRGWRQPSHAVPRDAKADRMFRLLICPTRLGKYSQRRPGCRTPFSYRRYHSAEDRTYNASPPISENYFLRHRATIEYFPSLDGQITDFPVQPPLQKYSASRFTQITSISATVPSPRGAARDRHRRGAGCGGRGSVRHARESQGGFLARERSSGELTNGADADGEVVWS